MVQTIKTLPISNVQGTTLETPTVVLGLEGDTEIKGSVTVDLVGATVAQALDIILTPYGISYVIESGTEDAAVVALSFTDVPVRDALRALGAAATLDFRYDGGVVRVSASGREAVAVVPPMFGGIDAATSIADGVGEGLDVSIIEGQTVIAGTRSDVKRFTDVADTLRARPPGQWAVNVWIVAVDDLGEWGLGVRGSPSVSASVYFGPEQISNALEVFLDVNATATASASDAQLLSKSSLILVEGRQSVVGSTVETPIPVRSVSPQGTVQTTGYEYISSGLSVTLEAFPITEGIEVLIYPELSSVQGFVNEVPILTKRSTQCSCLVKSGATVVISGMEELFGTSSFESPLYFSEKIRGSRILVVAHFVEVGY